MKSSWVLSSNVRYGVVLEKKDEEDLGSWNLDCGSFGYVVSYLREEKSTYF